MENKPTPIKVHPYRHRYITEYSDGSATFSGMKYETISKAMKAIDKILLLTKNVIG
jgi:hypothetical protein